MFLDVASFELRYQLKSPVLWITFLLFFLLTFLAVTVPQVQIGSVGNAHINGPFAITLKTGTHAGKRIGTMNADGGGKYSGKITDPANDKTYSGKATLSGNALKMSGCVLGGLICRGQNWQRM